MHIVRFKNWNMKCIHLGKWDLVNVYETINANI